MADVKVQIQVDIPKSVQNFQGALSKIKADLDKNPTKIKIDADTTELNKKIQTIKDSLKDIEKLQAKVGVDASDIKPSAGKDLTKGTTAYNNALKKTNDLLVQMNNNRQKWSAAENGATSSEYKSYVAQISNLERLKGMLETGTLKSKQFALGLSKIQAVASEMAKSINFADESTKAMDTLTVGTTKYNKALTQVSTLSAQIQSQIQSWTAADTGKSKTDYENLGIQLTELKKLESELKKGTVGEEDLSRRFSEIKMSATQSAEAIKRVGENAASMKALTSGTQEYNRALTQAHTLSTQIESNINNWTAAGAGSSKTSYNDLKNQLIEINTLIKDVETKGLSQDEFVNRFSSIKLAVTEASEAIKSAGENMKLPDNLQKGTTAYNNALSQIARQMETINSNKDKWTAASVGATANDYKIYTSQSQALKQLAQDIETTGVSQQEFAQRFSDIKRACTESSEAIKSAGKDTILLAQGTTEYNQALAKIVDVRSKLDSKISNLTIGENGVTAKSYIDLQNISNEYANLQSKLESGTISQRDFNNEMANLQSQAALASSGITNFGNSTVSFGTSLKNVIALGLKFVSVTQAIMVTIRTLKEMAKTSIEIESAMTRIQIVTGATDSQMDNFFAEATSRAKELGTSITDIAGSIETFSRLGLTY